MTAQTEEAGGSRRRWPILQGLLPVERSRLPVEVLAGVTLAALAIPEVMGYTSIAGMPVITGLYTILLPVFAFALLGSSRHLVVGADSATAALVAAGLAPLAAAGSAHYVALAGAVALLAAAFLLIARLIGLGFLADFLSRTVLVGFLTGVGIEVACGQVGGMLGVPEGKGITIASHNFHGTVGKLVSTLQNISTISWTTVAVSASVIVLIVFGKRVTTKVPAALVAVVGLILVSWHWDLSSHGVATLGPVPGGLPHLSLPGVGWGQLPSVIGTAASIFVLILAQSAATSRAYASKYDDAFDEDVDLVGLGAANVLAGVSGTFVVNGSPTKTQMVDGAGGRSQVAQLSMAVVVGVVLLFLTKPLQYMPEAVLAAVVFVIGIELVDIAGMGHIWRLRRDEFVVAASTAAVVVFIGVEQGIVFAVIASIVDHLRRSYRPPTSVLQRRAGGADGGDWRAISSTPRHRSEPGLVVYRFAAPLYYANASKFREEVLGFTESDEPLEWICLDLSATPDIDLTGLAVLDSLHRELSAKHVRLVMAEVLPEVQPELVRYGLVDLLGADAIYEGLSDIESAFEHRPPT
jgi:high affinity sulfate transporter 1